MAYRCLETLEINGTTYNLAQVSDFSIITSAMISGTTQRYSLGKQSNTGVLPSILSTFGDMILDCQGLMTESWIIGDTNYFAHKMGLYKYNNFESTSYDMFGGVVKNFVANSFLGQFGWSKGSTQSAFKSYLAIILDDENERAYYCYVYDTYKHWNNQTGVMCEIFAGKTNGEDLIWKSFAPPIPKYTSNGGGATHIAKVTGQLKDLSSNLSDILMVSGGGGGGLLLGETEYTGKEAGGISGSGDNSADQTTGNAFGQGESGTNVSGGGSGLYGGYKGTSSKSGGAGSGYIGNSLLSNKKMVGYNVPTSSVESTKTESINEVSASAVSGKPKIGNGFARIKFLREPDYYWIAQYTVDSTTYNLMQIGDVTIPDSIINATQMTCTAITGRGSTVPSFVINLGDVIFDLQSSIDSDVTLEFINNSFLRFLFGRYNYITSGTRMSGNQYYDVANSRVFYQGGWGNFSDGKVKYYIAIKIDKVNHRAYMIVLEHVYYHWAGNVGYTAYAVGGMPNGVDLLYETFKDVR